MTIWIDPPSWPAHGRLWSHLVSDASYNELHQFAADHGLPRRGFEGDHYDVPEERYAVLVTSGARPVPGRELVRLLQRSGLRMRKRRGEKGIARILDVEMADGGTVDVDLVESSSLAPEMRVFAAMAFVEDETERFAVVYSPRRSAWGSPGGRREGAETVEGTAVREVFEETGLRITSGALAPVGYERFGAHRTEGAWAADGKDILQLFRTRVAGESPCLGGEGPDVTERRWVTAEEFRLLCGGQFWWPLAEHVLGVEEQRNGGQH